MSIYCVLAVSRVAAAETAKAIPVEAALNVHFIDELSPLAVSPDGQNLAYVVRGNRENKLDLVEQARTGVPWHAMRADIWILNIKTGEKKNLTTGLASNWLPTWSPHGGSLAFFSDRDGSDQARLWIWDVARNELRRVSEVNVRGNEIEWSPDEKALFITTVPRRLSTEDYRKTLLSGKSPSDANDSGKTPGSSVMVFRPASAFANSQTTPTSDPWNLDQYLRDLVSVDVGTGRISWIVENQRIATYRISADGLRIAYSRPNNFELAGSQQTLFDIVSTDRLGRREAILATNVRLDYDGAAFSWSPSGSYLSFRAGGVAEKAHDCYLVNLQSGKLQNLTHMDPQPALQRKAETPLWDSKEENVYFIVDHALWRAAVNGNGARRVAQVPNREVRLMTSDSLSQLWTTDNGKSTIVVTHDKVGRQDGFYKISLDSGESTQLLEQGQCYTCTQQDHITGISGGGPQLVYFSEGVRSSSDLWISSPSFRNPQRLTHINPQFDRYDLGGAQLVSWSSVDGVELHGVLLLPPDYRKEIRYPLLVWVYGGHNLSDRLNHFGLVGAGPFNLQVFATRGYAVLLPDAPQHLGTPMLDLAKAVLPGVDKVISMGIADPDQVGVMGHSYGGYSVLSLIVQTTRFKAAIELDGKASEISAYGQMSRDGTAFQTSISEQGQGLMGGSPWQFRERYIENSPFFYFDRVQTPLLVIHGSEDKTVAPFLGDEVFVALRRLGKNVEYAKYEGENHSPLYWSYSNQTDLCNRMIEWFGRYLSATH
jgi:dipeptidyl aminopeptidase/acylaminoacyl peptidase